MQKITNINKNEFNNIKWTENIGKEIIKEVI